MQMSAAELGDNLAQLVWESFTDFIERRARALPEAGGDSRAAVLAIPAVEPEEVLIYFMWLHTRACQQGCGSDPEQVRGILDAMHQGLYEDLEARAIPRLQLPLFEQRVTVRYTEYYEAASEGSEANVVEIAARYILCADPATDSATILDLAEAATVTSGPLRDFLQDLDLG